jgi:Raf kinase inhibitor-like YbhB/YbcL family protein
MAPANKGGEDMRRLFAIALTGCVVGMSGARAAEPFALTSPAFKDGDVMASKYAGADPSRTNPPCPGENVSPPLAWSNPPSGAKSYALMLQDPDGANGLGVYHWIAYDIPLSRTSFAEGEASKGVKGWTGGKNAIGKNFYFGPCGPKGHSLHHYIFTMVATDLEPGSLKPDMAHDELIAALKGHALAPASIVARYTRPD